MASHAPQTILFVTNEGLVMDNGYSTRLAKGQFGIVDKGATPSALGMAVVDTFPTTPKDRLFELKLGIAPLTPTRSQSNKAYSSMPFKLSEVVDIKVNSPKLGVSVDEFIIGYDGINNDSALVLTNGDNEVIDITLSGEAIGMLGYPEAKVTVKLYLEAPNTGTFTMHEIVEKGVERLKDVTLSGGVPITDYIDVTPVNSTNALTISGLSYTFVNLAVNDAGNASALALVQAQYPDYLVKRESFSVGAGGGISKYTTIVPAGVTLTAFSQVITSQDSDCAGLPDCTDVTTSISWTSGASCNAIGKTYTLQLKDDECGVNKLDAIQAAYPNLTVAVNTDTANWRQVVTLSGVSGNASLVINGVTYTEAFATNLTTTAGNFVTSHAATILTATGAVVTSSGATIIITDSSESFPTVSAVAGGLVETLSEVVGVGTAATGACQTVYKTTVYTDIVCEECSPLLRDLFVAEAPEPYEFVNWEAAAVTYSSSAKMGIRLKSKVNIFAGSEEYRDELPFVYSSTRISIANAAPGTVSESFKQGSNGRFAVKVLSIGTEPEAAGGQFYDLEERTRVYFENRQRLAGNNYGKLVLGQESHLKPTVQYVDYSIRIRTNRFAQSFSGEVVENIDYHILVDACKYTGVEALVNALATAAGLPTVEAYPA